MKDLFSFEKEENEKVQAKKNLDEESSSKFDMEFQDSQKDKRVNENMNENTNENNLEKEEHSYSEDTTNNFSNNMNKKSLKILHCSDLHLGKRPQGNDKYTNVRFDDFFKAFEWIVDEAIKQDIDVMLITGDMFDKDKLGPDVIERTEKILNKIKETKENIKIIVIEGNHDDVEDVRKSWLHYLKGKGLIEIPPKPEYNKTEEKYNFSPLKIEGINFYGLGFLGNKTGKALKDLAEILNENEKNIVLVHTAIGDGLSFHGAVEKEYINALEGKAIYVAGGHFHSYKKYPNDNPFFFLPGAPEHWDIGETGERGYIVFDTENPNPQFVPYKNARRIISVGRDSNPLVIHGDTVEELDRKFRQQIPFDEITENDIVSINIKIEGKAAGRINRAEYRSLVENKNPLYLDMSIVGDISDVNIYSKNRNLSDLQMKIIKDNWEEFSEYHQYLSDKLDELKKEVDNFSSGISNEIDTSEDPISLIRKDNFLRIIDETVRYIKEGNNDN